MKNIVFTIAAFLLFGSAAFAQDPIEGKITDAKGNGVRTQPAAPAKDLLIDEIIAKHIDAIGGKGVIGRIQSMYMETIAELMGNTGKGSVTVLNGKGFRSELELVDSKMIQCFNDRGGWAVNPMAGGSVEDMPDQIYKPGRGRIYVTGDLFDYAAKGNKAELLGNDGTLYKIKLTNGDVAATYYIDSSTYLVNKLVRSGEMMGQPVEVIESFRDYKKTDFGFVVPYTTEMTLGQFGTVTKVTKVEINKPVDPNIFEKPK